MRIWLAVLAWMALVPSAALASAPRPAESASAGATVSDSERYAAWQHGSSLRVFDEESGSTVSFALPAGCQPPEAIGGGVVATVCGHAFQLLDVDTGLWAPVPATAASTRMFHSGQVVVDAVGQVWLDVEVTSTRAPRTVERWVQRGTGTVISRDPGDLHQYPDLDAAGLFAPLCAPLTRHRSHDAGDGTSIFSPFLAGAWAIDVSDLHLVLRHCGSGRERVMTRSRHWDWAWLTSTTVSWIVQDRLLAAEHRRKARGRVHVYELATGRRRSWPVPGPVNPRVHITMTREHIFIDKGSNGRTARRYMIDLR